MDGVFVPSLSYGVCVVESIRKSCDLTLDVHLMILEPERFVEAFAKAGADIITVHLEACVDVRETLDLIHRFGCRAGISIKPETPVEALEEYLEETDLVLIMCVEPGFGGQKYLPESTERIRRAADLIAQKTSRDAAGSGRRHHPGERQDCSAGRSGCDRFGIRRVQRSCAECGSVHEDPAGRGVKPPGNCREKIPFRLTAGYGGGRERGFFRHTNRAAAVHSQKKAFVL